MLNTSLGVKLKGAEEDNAGRANDAQHDYRTL